MKASLFVFLCGISGIFALPEVWPLPLKFGAHIKNIEVENIADDVFDLVHAVLLKYKVVIIPNQESLTIEGQRRFTQRFGKLHVHLESSSHYPGYSDVNVVSNIKNENGSYIGLFGAHVENFHSDLSWTPLPTKITVLKSVIRPKECGDTIFADTHAAYEGLDDTLKTELQGLKGNYCYLKLREIGTDGKAENLDLAEIKTAANCAVHPLVTTHPVTGRRNLYANPSHTASIVGMEAAASESLLQRLFEHTAKKEYALRHAYGDHDLIIWDNRAVHHRATTCPSEYPRKLVRTTVSNDYPPAFDATAAGTALAEAGARNAQTQSEYDFDLSKDRVNAQYPVKVTGDATAAEVAAATVAAVETVGAGHVHSDEL